MLFLKTLVFSSSSPAIYILFGQQYGWTSNVLFDDACNTDFELDFCEWNMTSQVASILSQISRHSSMKGDPMCIKIRIIIQFYITESPACMAFLELKLEYVMVSNL